MLVDLGDVRTLAVFFGGAVALLVRAGRERAAASIWGAVLHSRQAIGVRYPFPAWEELVEHALSEAVGANWQRYVEDGREVGIIEAARQAAEGLEAIR